MEKAPIISASYVASSDKYIAYIFDKEEYWIHGENGQDLVTAVKKETGVDIEYNWNNRTFSIPVENRPEEI